MEVTVDSEHLIELRRQVVELLFAEGNHICSVCVSNGACELQDVAAALGVDHIRFDLRNPFGDPAGMLQRVYVPAPDRHGVVPDAAGIVPALLPQAQPLHRVVDVDVYLPGCPPSAEGIRTALRQILDGGDERRTASGSADGQDACMHDVVIDAVTRIEGHAKITLALDDVGNVIDARFHVTEFRGFEDFCRGRPVFEMPALTARTCGIARSVT